MRYNKMLESLDSLVSRKDLEVRRYSLSDVISESYRLCYESEEGSNFHKLAEANVEYLRNNPKEDLSELSTKIAQLKSLKESISSGKIKDSKLFEEKVEESSEECKNELPDGDQPYEDPKDYSINEADDPEISDEELEELAKHLEEYRKKKSEQVNEESKFKRVIKNDNGIIYVFDERGNTVGQYPDEKSFEEVYGCPPEEYEEVNASKEVECDSPTRSWSEMKESLSNYSKLSTKKAFYKTFKKLSEKLSEGTALTRQESLDLYKATNSAMTQLSVELEHNPEFLETFNEATKILSEDEASLLCALRNNKGPSKKTMKSLSKFAETIFYEDEEEILYDEEEETLEDPEIIEEPSEEETSEESEEKSEEEEAFDQDYADARQEVHDELVAAHGTSEDPAVQEKIDQDAIEVKVIQGEDYEEAAEEVAAERAAAEGLSDEEVSAEDSEEVEDEEVEANESLDLEDITPDELEELKKKLKEMRESK